jgi:hypothetical protein
MDPLTVRMPCAAGLVARSYSGTDAEFAKSKLFPRSPMLQFLI